MTLIWFFNIKLFCILLILVLYHVLLRHSVWQFFYTSMIWFSIKWTTFSKSSLDTINNIWCPVFFTINFIKIIPLLFKFQYKFLDFSHKLFKCSSFFTINIELMIEYRTFHLQINDFSKFSFKRTLWYFYQFRRKRFYQKSLLPF